MLILNRMVGESIRIGSDVKVTVVQVEGTRARIGIDAPRGVRVDRQEIRERIERGETPRR